MCTLPCPQLESVLLRVTIKMIHLLGQNHHNQLQAQFVLRSTRHIIPA